MKRNLLMQYTYRNYSSIGLAFGCAVGSMSRRKELHRTMNLKQRQPIPVEMHTSKPDGYTTLDDANKYIRALFNVHKRYHYNRNERPNIDNYVMPDKSRYAIICTNGDFVFADTDHYFSLYSMNTNEIVEVWTITSMRQDCVHDELESIKHRLAYIYKEKIQDRDDVNTTFVDIQPKDYDRMPKEQLSKFIRKIPTIQDQTIDIASYYPASLSTN